MESPRGKTLQILRLQRGSSFGSPELCRLTAWALSREADSALRPRNPAPRPPGVGGGGGEIRLPQREGGGRESKLAGVMPGKNCGRAGAAPAEPAGWECRAGRAGVQGTREGQAIREGQETREKGLWGQGVREEQNGRETRAGMGWKGRGAESMGNPSGQEDGEPENCGAGKGKQPGVAVRYGKDGGQREEGFGKTRG